MPKSSRRGGSGASSRRGGAGGEGRGGRAADKMYKQSGPPMHLIMAAGGGALLLAIIIGVSMSGGSGKGGSGGGGGGGGDPAVRAVVQKYLDAWKSGSPDTLSGLETMTPADAAAFVAETKRKYEVATGGTRKPKDVRGKVTRHAEATNELGNLDDDNSWESADKLAVARKIVTIAYKAYFDPQPPPLSYEIKGVDVEGDRATARVSITTQPGNDYPELVPIERMMKAGTIKLIRQGNVWMVAARGAS